MGEHPSAATEKAFLQNELPPCGKPEDWERLRELCRDLVALRRGDHTAERLKIDREQIHWGDLLTATA